MSYFVHVDNEKKDLLNLGDGHTEGLEHTLTSGKIFSINFIVIQINFVWACIIMEQIVIYLLIVQKSINLKTKILRLWQLHYTTISKDWSVDNMKRTGFSGYD